MMKYPQPHSLRKYYEETMVDKIHHAIKHGEDLKKYQVYLKPMKRASNGHKTRPYATS